MWIIRPAAAKAPFRASHPLPVWNTNGEIFWTNFREGPAVAKQTLINDGFAERRLTDSLRKSRNLFCENRGADPFLTFHLSPSRPPAVFARYYRGLSSNFNQVSEEYFAKFANAGRKLRHLIYYWAPKSATLPRIITNLRFERSKNNFSDPMCIGLVLLYFRVKCFECCLIF